MEAAASATGSTTTWFRSDRVVVIPDECENVIFDSLDAAIVSCLHEKFRIVRLFPIQAFLIGAIQRDRRLRIDSCISSPTGSGKTLCFALPIIQNLSDRVVPRLRALVLVPTRDLAIQLRDVIGKLGACVGLRTGLAIGQRSFEFEQTELMSGSGVDILICTPGRLTDHLQLTPGFTLQYLEYLVLDEADRLFGQNFQSWEVSFQRARATSFTSLQTLLFSATMSLNPLSLATLQLRTPVFYCRTVQNEFACAASLKQQMLVCPEPTDKIAYLVWVLRQHTCKKIIFANALEASHNLKRMLEIFGEFDVHEFHSGLRQKQRIRTLSAFKSGCDSVLICSDVMARGIDIDGIELVVNYDCPNFLRTYLHRVGRTARANKRGVAVTLVLSHEVRRFRSMLRHTENNRIEKLSIGPTHKQAVRQEVKPYIEVAQTLFDAEQRNRVDRSQAIRVDLKESLTDIRNRILSMNSVL